MTIFPGISTALNPLHARVPPGNALAGGGAVSDMAVS
jgi:hypothetical protein